jgi:hypothetical protein
LFAGAMLGSLLPARWWPRLPASFPMVSAAFASGLATLLVGAAIGIPGFLEHAHANTSLGLDAELHHVFTDANAGYRQGYVQGFSALSIFTFLLMTPRGWLTMYLLGSGGLRMAAAWFDDAIGDPALTAIAAVAIGRRDAVRVRRSRETREAREGPEVPDRVVSSAAAGIGNCDLVIVSSRRKPGWERNVVVVTGDKCYRIGEPVERTVAGRLRTLYPLTEHGDLEAIRKSVRYEIPS